MGNTLQKHSSSEQNQQHELQVTTTEPPDEQPEYFTCEICIEPVLLPNKQFNNQNLCIHPFCTDCIIKYITVKLEDNISNIPCPALNCEQILDPISCQNLVGPNLFVKWCDVLCESAVLGLAQCYCPNQNCSALILDECCGGDVKRSECPNCKSLFCFKCKVTWHAGFQCEETGEFRDRNDVAFGVLAERNKWMRCPHCRRFVQLIAGCSIVRCRCGIDFCYKCGKRVYKHQCDCNSSSRCYIWIWRCLTVLVLILGFYLFFWDPLMKSKTPDSR